MANQLSRRNAGLRPWWELSPLTGLRDEMDQLFSRFFDGSSGISDDSLSVPSLDLSETDDELEFRIDLPGYKPEEIDVSLDRDLLTVSGEHSEETKDAEDGRRYHRIERRHGSFRRSIQLPSPVREDDIDAGFQDGVLTIRMPKADVAKSKKIPVKG